MDTEDHTIKPAVRAQYILDNYSESLNKTALNKLSEWPEWLNKVGQHAIHESLAGT